MSSKLTLYNGAGQEVEITGDSIQGSAIGSVEFMAGITAPAGYITCPDASAPDSAYPLKTAYPDLYSYIGDTWGVLTDTLRFKIPNSSKDGKGYFNRGTGNVGVGTQQDDVFKEHDHIAGYGADAPDARYGITPNLASARSDNETTSVNSTGGANTSNSGDATETRPMAQTMLMCIKAFHSVASTGDVDLTKIVNDFEARLIALETT